MPPVPANVISRSLRCLRELQRRYNAIGGPTLAGGVTLSGFLALFALLVLGVAILGFLSADNSHLARDITAELGLTGQAARIITDSVSAAQKSRSLATVVGVVGILWLGTSFALVLANAFDAAWRVPGRGLLDRAWGLVWLSGATVLLGAGGLATAGWDLLPTTFAPLVVAISLTMNAALWIWTSWILPNRAVAWRILVLPALLAAVAFEVLKSAGAYIVPQYVARSSELYGTIGVVFALLLWFLILGRVVVYVAVIEAWRAERSAPVRIIE